MKKKVYLILIAAIVIFAVLWLSGIVPKKIAEISGTHYVKEHFPEMRLECVNVEWADVYGDYLITFQDKDGSIYSCVIGPSIFPCRLGQGLFEIQEHYTENYQ